MAAVLGGLQQVWQSCQRQLGSCGDQIKRQLFGTTNVDLIPHGAGLAGGATVEFNTGETAGGGTVSGEIGTTITNQRTHQEFLAASAGGFVTSLSNLNQHESYPGQTLGQDPMAVAGDYAGAGLGLNAQHTQDLAGPFTQYSFTAGAGDALSVQLSVGQNSRGEGIYNCRSLRRTSRSVPVRACPRAPTTPGPGS